MEHGSKKITEATRNFTLQGKGNYACMHVYGGLSLSFKIRAKIYNDKNKFKIKLKKELKQN